jgi:uncharacterized membrane protein YccC
VISDLGLPFDWKGELNRAIADCARLTRRRGVESARERNEHRAYYACGTVFGLVAEGASGKPFHHFVRALVDAHRDQRIVTRADWLAALDARSRDRTLSRDILRLLERGAADPAQAITSLLERAEVQHRIGEDGLPRLP